MESDISRRHFWRRTVLAYCVSEHIFASGTYGTQANLAAMSRDVFNGLLRTAFTTEAADKTPVHLVLTAVIDLTPTIPPAPGTPLLDTFGLELSGAREGLPQGSYMFRHATLGTLTLFIVPSGPASYLAVINHLMTPLPAGYAIPTRSQQAAAQIRPVAAREAVC